MSELMNAYEEAYGSNEKVFLRMLGGNPDEIAARVEELEAQSIDVPASNFFGFIPDTTPAEDLHNEIIKEISRRYFSTMSRETALAICNTLGDLGQFSPCSTIPALIFNSASLMYA